MLYRLYREDSSGRSVLLGTFSGESGSAAHTDTGLRRGASYSYYIIPVHPQLMAAGQPLTGTASMHITVSIPSGEDD